MRYRVGVSAWRLMHTMDSTRGPVAPSAHLDTAVALLEVAFDTKFTASKSNKHGTYIIHTADSPICRYQN
jgi:hypothetical protein